MPSHATNSNTTSQGYFTISKTELIPAIERFKKMRLRQNEARREKWIKGYMAKKTGWPWKRRTYTREEAEKAYDSPFEYADITPRNRDEMNGQFWAEQVEFLHEVVTFKQPYVKDDIQISLALAWLLLGDK